MSNLRVFTFRLILSFVVLFTAADTCIFAQMKTNGSAPPSSSVPPASKDQTTPLNAVATVKDNVVVTGGLLTYASAKELFGGWVADHFIVVQVTIGNQSRDQQFILHDIFLDYSQWGLSGVYANPGFQSDRANQLQDYQKPTNPAQISSISALGVHDAYHSQAIFSHRNFVVNGLVLVGTTATAFSFLAPPGFAQGTAGFTGAFIPALQKFWPDKTIDQQSNVLKYGFQEKLVAAKEDPVKTYAFFPIERFLTSGLVDLYKREPALFLNLAEAYLDPALSTSDSPWHFHWVTRIPKSEKRINALSKEIDPVIISFLEPPDLKKPDTKITCDSMGSGTVNVGCAQSNELRARVVGDMFSACYYGPKDPSSSTADPKSAQPLYDDDCELIFGDPATKTKVTEIRKVKDFISHLSLNSVRLVVSGIMSVDVETIPAVLTKVDFDQQTGAPPVFEDIPSTHTGVISGKYLTDGKPVINAIKVPGIGSPKVGDYIDSSTLAADAKSSTDTELHFSVKFKQVIPNGSTLSFQATKNSSKSVNSEANSANTQETTTSMSLPYDVKFTPTLPTITKVTFDPKGSFATAKGTLTGHLSGSMLTAISPAVISPTISAITLPDGTPATPASDLMTVAIDKDTSKSTADTLSFVVTIGNKAIPIGTKITFQASKTVNGSTSPVTNPYEYTVSSASPGDSQ